MKILILLMAAIQLFAQEELYHFYQNAFPGSSAVYGDTIITNYQSENLFLSVNAGKNWDTINLNHDLSCREIIKKDNIVYLLSGDGALLKVDLLTKEVDDIAPIYKEYPSMNDASSLLIKDDLIIIGKDEGTLEISFDGGKNWEERKLHNNDISRIAQFENEIYLVLENSLKDHIIAKYDIETNRLTPISRFYNYIYKLEVINNKLFICGSEGLLAFTENKGKSWKHFNTKLPWSIKNLKLYKGDLYAEGGFDETYIWKINLSNNTISEPSMILDAGSYIMDISNDKMYLWRRKPDKLLAFRLKELIK